MPTVTVLVPGHFICLIIPGWYPFLIAFIYLHHPESFSFRNSVIPARLGHEITHRRLPFLLAGDFDMPPDLFTSSAWHHMLNAKIITTGRHTYYHSECMLPG